MIERVPSSITPASDNESSPVSGSLEALTAFDKELHDHMENHISQGDFFHLLATYMGFFEETAADPDSVPPELREMQARLLNSMRKSLRQIQHKYHIMELPKTA